MNLLQNSEKLECFWKKIAQFVCKVDMHYFCLFSRRINNYNCSYQPNCSQKLFEPLVLLFLFFWFVHEYRDYYLGMVKIPCPDRTNEFFLLNLILSDLTTLWTWFCEYKNVNVISVQHLFFLDWRGFIMYKGVLEGYWQKVMGLWRSKGFSQYKNKTKLNVN